MILHRLDLDGADTGRVGERCSRHAGEDHRADDVDLRQPTLHPADKGDGEGIDAAGDTRRIHQIAGQDKEWHGEEREAFDAGDHALRDDDVGGNAEEHEIKDRRHRHGNGDRHADKHEDKKSSDKQ